MLLRSHFSILPVRGQRFHSHGNNLMQVTAFFSTFPITVLWLIGVKTSPTFRSSCLIIYPCLSFTHLNFVYFTATSNAQKWVFLLLPLSQHRYRFHLLMSTWNLNDYILPGNARSLWFICSCFLGFDLFHFSQEQFISFFQENWQFPQTILRRWIVFQTAFCFPEVYSPRKIRDW